MSKNCTNDGCNCTPNSAIKCSVTNCAHHCQDVDHCGLTSIQVGTHEANHGPVYRLPELPQAVTAHRPVRRAAT